MRATERKRKIGRKGRRKRKKRKVRWGGGSDLRGALTGRLPIF